MLISRKYAYFASAYFIFIRERYNVRSSRDITFLRLSRHWRFPRSTHFSSKVIDVYLNSSYAYTHTHIYIHVPVRECPLEESFLFTFRPFHTGVSLAQIENGTKLKIDRTISMLIAMKMEKEGTRADIASPTITIVQLISKIFTHFSLLPTIALSTSSYSSVSNDFTPLRDGHIPSTFILDLPKSIFCVIWVILFIFFFFKSFFTLSDVVTVWNSIIMKLIFKYARLIYRL